MDRSTAINDFYEAHRKASMKTVLSKITGETVDLLSYDEILKRLRMKGQIDRGRAEIDLDKIIGSVGRYTDFTKDFLPRKLSDSDRWASVKMATESLSGVPPIEVYKIGDSYFVRDGNHRVSIARSNGQDQIEAYVTEVFTRVPLTGNLDLDSLIIKEEYAGFLEETRLDKLLDEPVDLSVTVAGAYEKLLDHIKVHHYYMGIDAKKEIAYDEAVIDWYKSFYLPVIETIREHGLMKDFPNRTETDLYIWMLEYRSELEAELGWKIDTDIAAATITERFSKSTKLNLRRLWFWITDKLIPDSLEFGPKTGTWRVKRGSHARMKNLSFFRNILIAMQENDISRETLEQTIWIARQEG
ncbi:MAG: universal stress protein, partial [Anaerolineaceae bacterium]|nr:universal stress protein [Anaerolineaceae bacterium]